MNVGQVIVQIGSDLRNFEAGLRQATRDARDAARQMEQSFRNAFGQIDNEASNLSKSLREVGRIVSGILISQAFYNGMNAVENATGAVFEFSMALEDAYTKWEAMLGSKKDADRWVGAMQDFAQRTPFDFEGVSDAATKIKMMGVETEKVLPILETLGNAVALNGGDSLMLRNITRALRQMYASPKAQAEEVEQFVEGQIDAAKYLKQELGLTAQEVKKIGDTGVSGKDAALAILKGIAKDPAYKDGMKKLSDNTKGMINSIKEGSKYLGSIVFSPVYKKISSFIRKVRDLIDDMIDEYKQHGLGGLFERFVPKGLQDEVRMIVAALKSMWDSTVMIFGALKPLFKEFGKTAVQALSIMLPALAVIMRAFAQMLQTLEPIMPLLGKLLFLLIALGAVRSVVVTFTILSKAIMFLWRALGATGALRAFSGALGGLVRLLANPYVAAGAAIVFIIYKIAQAAGVSTAWVEKLLARLGQLFGMDTSKLLQPVDNGKGDDYADLNQDLLDIIDNGDTAGDAVGDAMDDAKDGAKGARKEMEKFIAAFDEVYQVPEKNGAGSGGGGGGGKSPLDDLFGKDDGKDGGGKKLPGLEPKDIPIHFIIPPFKLPKIPKLKINWEWFPPLGAAATAWIATMDQLREALKQLADGSLVLQGVLEGLAGAFVPGYAMKGFYDSIVDLNDILRKFIDTLTTTGLAGTGFATVFGGAMGKVVDAFSPLKPALGGMGKIFEETFSSIIQTVGDFAINHKNSLNTILETAGQFGINYGPIITAAFQVYGSVKTKLDTFVSDHQTSLNTLASAARVFSGDYVGSIGNISAAWAGLPKKIKKSFEDMGKEIETGLAIIGGAIDFAIGSSIRDMQKQWDEIVKSVEGLLKGIQKLWEDYSTPILVAVGVIIAGIVAFFFGLPAAIATALVALVATVSDVLGGVSPAAAAALEDVPDTTKNPFKGMPGYVEGQTAAVNKDMASLNPELKTALKDVPGTLNSPFNGYKDNVLTLNGQIVKSFQGLPESIRLAIKNIPSIVAAVLGQIKLPSFSVAGNMVTAGFRLLKDVAGFANGGIIGADSIVRVGEKGRREAIIPLQNASAMAPFADAVASRLGGTQNQNQQPTMYVGTLIADDRSLRELERRMRVVRTSESERGVFR